MADLDKSFQSNETDIDVSPDTVEGVYTSSKNLENFKALKAAFLENYNTGEPVVDLYMKYAGSVNKDRDLSRLAVEKDSLDKQATNEVLNEIAETDPEIFVDSVNAASLLEETKAIDETATDSTKQFVDAVSDINATDEMKAAASANIKMWEMLSEATDRFDAVDYILDFGAELIPLRSTKTEASLLGGVFNNTDKVEQMIFNFKSKPVKEQQEIFPLLIDEVLSEMGPIRGLDLLTKFVDPATEEELGDFSNWWKVVDAVDIASLGATAAIKIAKAKQAFNLPKVLNNVGNKEKAGDAVAAALVDKEAADAMAMTQETAFGDGVAFDTSLLDLGHTKGVSTATLEGLTKFFGKADKTAEDIMAGNGYLKEGILNTVERANKEKEAFEILSNAKHENIVITGRTENTTSFKYQALDEDGKPFDDEFVLDLTLNDVGQYNQSEIMTGSGFLNSPTVFAKGLTRLDVDTAQVLDEQTAKVFKNLMDLQRDALSPIGSLLTKPARKKLAKIDEALRKGDEYKNLDGTRGRLFKPEDPELADFDDGMLQAYYSVNRLYNNLWRLRNNNKREEMIAFGFKKVNLLDEEYSFGKPFDTAGDASNSLRSNNVGVIFDAVEDKVIDAVSTDVLDTHYASGKKLVKLNDGYNTGAERGRFTYVLVNADTVEELPAVVLNRKVGYVPKVAKDGFWFVKEFGDTVVDGKVKSTVLKTHRYFDNKADAVKFRDSLREKAIREEGLTESQAANKFKELEDREQEIVATATGNFSHGSGGLYTGARAQDDILFGLNGDEGQRINPFEALMRNISNISKQVPINQWRLGMEQRWINTANKLLDVKIDKFESLPKNIESTRAGEFLNKMAEQIRDWQGFPTTEEQVYNSLVQRLYEWALRSDRNKTAKIVGWMRDRDPISASRAAAFHSLLGWFNPAQLWIQAQGMSIAGSIALGKNLTETLKHTTGLTILGQAENLSKTRLSLAAKAAGVSPEELLEIHTLWKKTGLEDSILQTADHAAALRGHGIAMDALSTAADKGLWFYRGGELLNRRMAFTVALDELKNGSIKGFEFFKKGDAVTDAALKAVLVRTNNLTLNMTKAARAQWQKGILSVPTQFFGITARTLETVLGFNDNLTGAERMRVLAGQVALYGAAGIPLVTMGTQYLLQYAGATQKDIDDNPVLVKLFNDGFWGFVTLGIMGIDAEVSQRGSLLRGVTDFVDNWVFSEATVGEKLLGAFGATGFRFWDELTEQVKPLMFGAYPIDIIDAAKIPLSPVLNSVSTWRNGEKAVFMQLIDKILTRRGDVLVERPFELRESIAAAIGFRLSDEVKPYTLNERSKHVVDTRSKIADLVVKMMNSAASKAELGLWTEDNQKDLEQNYALIVGALEWDDRTAVRELVRKRLSSKSKEIEAITRYRKMVGERATDGLSAIQGMLGSNIQTIDKQQEE